jgi:hypothetical protein
LHSDDKGGKLWIVFRQRFRERMVSRNRQKRRTEQGIGTGGENFYFFAATALDGEIYERALGFADPIFLHQAHFFGQRSRVLSPCSNLRKTP